MVSRKEEKVKVEPVLAQNGSTFMGMPLEQKGFCAVLSPDGKAEKSESNGIEDFCTDVGSGSISWVDYVVDDFDKEVLPVAIKIGFSEPMLRLLIKESRSAYEDFGNELGMMIPAIVAKGFDVKVEPLIILIKENLIVTLHTTEVKRFFRLRRYAETFMKKLPSKMPRADKITNVLIRILDENNSRNFEHLRDIEEEGDKLSKYLSDPKTPREVIGKQIPKMKHALSGYLGGLWSTLDVLNSLRYGDADLITDEPRILDRLTMLVSEVNTQIGLSEHLSEVLASGLEVMQSIYNNQLQLLNNRLAMLVGYLTIIGTALLVPNTIATVASGPFFEFGPKDEIWYIGVLIISTILATVVAWFVVRKMGLLPKSPDAK